MSLFQQDPCPIFSWTLQGLSWPRPGYKIGRDDTAAGGRGPHPFAARRFNGE